MYFLHAIKILQSLNLNLNFANFFDDKNYV